MQCERMGLIRERAGVERLGTCHETATHIDAGSGILMCGRHRGRTYQGAWLLPLDSPAGQQRLAIRIAWELEQ